MSNPLLAQKQDSTTWHSGINVLDDAAGVYDGVQSGSWIEGGIAAFGTGMDLLTMAMNPVGTLISYGLNWLIEHVKPLQDALNQLAGDADQIAAYAQTWKNVGEAVGKAAKDLAATVEKDTANWAGAAADAYRANIKNKIDHINAASTCANTIGTVVQIVGVITGAVRGLVRDMVTQAIGDFIQDALEEVCSLGLGTPVVVAQVVEQVSAWMEKIGATIKKLINSVEALRPMMSKLEEIFAAIKKVMSELHGHPGEAEPHLSGDGSTHASAAVDEPHTTPAGSEPHTSATGEAGTDAPATSTTGDGTAGSHDGGARDPSMKDNSGDPQADGRQKQCAPGSGDPVDLTTGQMFMGQTDLELPGVLPLVLGRTHFSDYRVGRWFGRSWASTLDQRIEIEDDGIYFADEDGARLRYPLPSHRGDPVFAVAGPRWPLELADNGEYRIIRPEKNEILHFHVNSGPVWSISAISDRNGNRIDFVYDATGAPAEIRHSGGYRVGVDTSGGLITGLRLLVDDARDISLTRYQYNDRRQLIEVTNSSNRAMSFEYDLAGRITRWQDRNGEWYRYEFDGQGRVIRTEGSGDALTGSWSYDTESRITVYTDALGNASTYHYDEAYQIIREINPLGQQVLREWDGYNRLAAFTDPLGRTTRYEYDEAGAMTTVTRPDGTQELAEYNEFSQHTTVVDPNGAVWRYVYDERGNRIETVDPLGARTRFQYDERGHLVSTVDVVGNVRGITNNEAGLPVAVTDPLGATTRGTRDQFGRLASVIDELGRVTTFTWTVEGEMLSRTDPTGATERWRYDGEGNRVEHTDPAGRVTTMQTTHFDLPASQMDPDGARTEFHYDRELRLVAVTNAEGQVWNYEYDAAGNLVRERDFDGRGLTYHYDAAGQLIRRVNGAGEAVDYVRDARGHVIERRSADGLARFEFDAIGRMIRAVNSDADVSFERDVLGRVIAETVNGRTVSSRYDALGRRVYRRTPTGAESEWSYDAKHQPVALRTAGRTLSFGYDPAGRETERLLDTGTILAQAWDPSDRLTSQSLSAVVAERQGVARTIQRREYRYRPDGLLTAVSDLSGTRSYDLDPAGRVVTVQGSQHVERYAYDRAGNLVDSGDMRYAQDAQGRVVMRQRKRLSAKPATWRYSWDAEDRLTAVITPDGTRWCYLYDALGRRVAKQRLQADGRPVEQIDFSWDGTTVAEQTHSGGLSVTWNYEPRSYRPATQVERVPDPQNAQAWVDRAFYSIITDIVGTPTELIDQAGNLAWRSATTLWGAALAELISTTSTPWRFPGQYHDPETGLHYNFQRYYDPIAGRYCSKDPLGLSGGPNPSGYVRNPWHWVDPLGLAETCDPALPARPENSPAYSVVHEAQLEPGVDFPGRSDKHHFAVGNRQLHAAFESDPAFAKSMNELYPGIVDNVKPGPRGAFPRTSPHEDLTWHHEANRPGTLQLVPRAHHAGPGPVQGSLHPGGRGGMENWGGGRRR